MGRVIARPAFLDETELPEILLKTARLQVLPFEDADFPLLLDLHSDPEVNRYHSPGPVPMAKEEARRRLNNYVQMHRQSGVSKWKLETLDGEFVGRAGFSWQQEPAGYELGYSLKRSAWGRGYATEIARELVRWFFEETDHDHLLAYAVSENLASLRVMQKAGMRLWLEMEKHDLPCTFYRVDRTEFENLSNQQRV
ncbi:GNAT family N-acetyltransferase [Roseibium sp. SCPC15]|uniref:GNAT family N-acetyltransferase n=1 Tax=Roseibium sp. SCP15 TaxID=3141376 RepID=UPI003338F1B4